MIWNTIVGHQREIRQLNAAMKEGRLHHALLFSGIEGIGKRFVAVGFAKALNCLLENDSPCGRCLSCKKIEKGSHPDFFSIEPVTQQIKIEMIRELKKRIMLHPLEGRAKVVLIDPADMMTEAASNALLKILEEPPSRTHFILITANPTRLLPTIFSRCQRLPFSPLSEKEIAEYLSGKGMGEEEVKQRVIFSQGSLKNALQFEKEFFENVKAELGNLENNPKPSHLLKLAESWMEDEERLPFLLKVVSHLWHQKILATKEEALLEKRTRQWLSIEQAHQALRGYANKQLLLEDLLFTLSAY